MKQTFFLFILLNLLGTKVFANDYDISVENADGVNIRYKYINNGLELELTGSYYKYDRSYILIIPEEVTYMGRTRKVTSIGDNAFLDKQYLTSVTIPSSVISIGEAAFKGCSRLTSFTIPNSVTSIGEAAFYGCSGLTSVTIPNGVTNIEKFTFAGCTALTSVTIPNGVTSIGMSAFASCGNLISVTIPSSVTSIDAYAFERCEKLQQMIVYDIAAWCNIQFGDDILREANSTTRLYSDENTEITNLIIPNGVTSIPSRSFSWCSSLVSVTIPASVKKIGWYAFSGCSSLTSIISQIENPFAIDSSSNTFPLDVFMNTTLYVPVGTIDKYKEKWKEFVFIEESAGGVTPVPTPEPQKCEKPTISYQNGKLTFNTDTQGATCKYTITDTDIKSDIGNEVNLTLSYNICVYATKVGYNNSETATATLCWIETEPKSEDISNKLEKVKAYPVLIQSKDGQITVQGVAEKAKVAVYTINGVESGNGVANNGIVSINTNINSGEIAIIKIGEKSVKVVMK